MRLTLFVLAIAVLNSTVLVAAGRAGDEPLEGRQELSATMASDAVTGDELARLQLAQLLDELHFVQLEVERFSVDESTGPALEDTRYPYSINQLVVETYSEYRDAMLAYASPGLYPNPYTASGADDLNAGCVPFGWSDLHPGNFSYLTRFDRAGNVVGYLLVGYGPDRESGMDIDGDGTPDGVVMTLESGPAGTQQLRTFYDSGRSVTLPSLSAE